MTNDVKFNVKGTVGIITLMRPQALNALNLEMCIAIYNQLKTWANDDSVEAVVICGEGKRGFCAGGDIRYFYDNGPKQWEKSQTLFWHEYRLDHCIFHYPKPYIALCHGITMGGGIGISAHGAYRVGAPNLKWAMPETGIGFFPDVGASYLLSNLTGKLGLFLGLTGNAITVEDACYAGLIDYIIPYEQFLNVIDALVQKDFESIDATLQHFARTAHASTLQQYEIYINEYFQDDDPVLILKHLSDNTEAWCEEMSRCLVKRSPTSLWVVCQALCKAKALKDFDRCLQMEYHIASHMLQKHDFYEGIRAAIIDKDRSPHWQPSSLQSLDKMAVSVYFEPLNHTLSFEK